MPYASILLNLVNRLLQFLFSKLAPKLALIFWLISLSIFYGTHRSKSPNFSAAQSISQSVNQSAIYSFSYLLAQLAKLVEWSFGYELAQDISQNAN